MPTQPTPPAEVEIDAKLVRRLVMSQHPDLDAPLAPLASGWDNVMFRLGDELVVRLPRRAASVELILSEQRWLPILAPRLPLPIPVPLRVGVPSEEYAWPWSIVPYIHGSSAMAAVVDRRDIDLQWAAVGLGGFCAALHTPAVEEAPPNPYRGVPLADRDAAVRQRSDQLGSLIDAGAVIRRWDEALSAPPWVGPAMWLHGDLHPGNVLVDSGNVTGVVDFGDITAGDPATDLAVAWMLFASEHREAFRNAAGPAAASDDTWARARGWALALGLAILAHSEDDPRYRQMAITTITETLDD